MGDPDDIEAIREQRRQELLQHGTRDGGPRPPSPSTTATPDEPVHVGSKAELEQLAADHRIVLADFYADWCGPCKMLEPTVREIAQRTEAAVAKVDVDALPGLAQELRVQGVPSLFLYVDGEPVKRLVGVQDYGTLESLVEQYGS
jgi:thioredoxin 1